MDEELFLATQQIKELKVYRVWDVTHKVWCSKKYTRKGDAISNYSSYVDENKYVIVTVSSISETKYEWI